MLARGKNSGLLVRRISNKENFKTLNWNQLVNQCCKNFFSLTTRQNKLVCLSLAKISNLIQYLRVTPEPTQEETLLLLGKLTLKYETRRERLVRDKWSSIFEFVAGWPEDLKLIHPMFQKVAQTVSKPKKAKISTTKFNLKAQNIYIKPLMKP